eukprot:1144540-Pelagomonas_calceolata.AAC.4
MSQLHVTVVIIFVDQSAIHPKPSIHPSIQKCSSVQDRERARCHTLPSLPLKMDRDVSMCNHVQHLLHFNLLESVYGTSKSEQTGVSLPCCCLCSSSRLKHHCICVPRLLEKEGLQSQRVTASP